MHYSPILICLIAISLCFDASRTDGRLPSSKHGNFALMAETVDKDGNHLVQLLKDCDQSLDSVVAEFANRNSASLPSGFPETCKRLVTLVGIFFEDSHRVLHPRYHQNGVDQTPINPNPMYHLQHAMPETVYHPFPVENDHAPYSHHSIPPKYTPKRSYRREICEAKVCPAKGLEKTCNSKKLQPSTAQTCKMCYPTPNPKLISEHCQELWKRERKAFYVVCFVLIATTLITGFLLHLRRYFLRKRQPQAVDVISNKETGEIYHYDGAKSPESPGHDNSEPGGSQEANHDEEAADSILGEEDGDIGSATAQRKWKQLGLFSRTGRKKIQDLFDLEAMRSRQPNDKIPVMPRAPNSTVRGSRRGRIERQLPDNSASAVELQEMRKSDAV